MAKSQETLELEEALYRDTRKMSVFGCFEVTIGFWKERLFGEDQRVDYLTMDTNGIFRAYEVKVTKTDFHSKCANSFVGHFNYYVMPYGLYEQVKSEIPDNIGVWCGSVIKKPKRVEPCVPVETLMKSMVRSLYRDADRYLMAIYKKDTPENQRLEKERKKNRETISQLRREVNHLQQTISFYEGSPIQDLGERARSIEFYRELLHETSADTRELRKENERLRAEMERANETNT